MNGMSAIRNGRNSPFATGFAVVDDVVERDRHCRVVALDHHAERVADQHDIGAPTRRRALRNWRRNR